MTEDADAPTEVAPVSPRRRLWRGVLVALAGLVALPLVLTVVYAVVPPVSTLMLWRWATFQPVTRTYVEFHEVAPVVARSVVVSEDARFCFHGGVDVVELGKVVEDFIDGEATRGASTIPMQLAKNLFLWPGRDPVRKAIEIPLAMWIDLVLSKRKIVEIYLNVAEWGPDGVFGVEAAAQRAFGRSAGEVTGRQAALLAAVLPNPIARDPAKPSRAVARRAARIAAEAGRTGGVLDCILPPG